MNLFVDWLDEELRRRDWSDYELARRAKISHSVISRARQGTLPKWAACAAIAQALNLSFEIVFWHAGLISKLSNVDERTQEFGHLFSQLAPRFQETVIEFIKNRIEEQERLEETIKELRAGSSSQDVKRVSDALLGYVSSPGNDK